MLAFDIETLGLNPLRHAVTVVCTEDYHTGERRKYEFARHAPNPDTKKQLTEELISAFDAADCLCAFNGVRFDLPFLQKALGIDPQTVTGWVLKTTDILEQSRLRYKTTFSLNLLCEHNGIPVKISSGLHAVKMAQDGEYDKLAEYCEDDTAILCKIYRIRHITLPKLNQQQDLMLWAPDSVYRIKKEEVPTDIKMEPDVDVIAKTASVGEMIDDLIASITTEVEKPPPTYSRIVCKLYIIRQNYLNEMAKDNSSE